LRKREIDRKIVIEEGVGGKKHKAREIECSVLGTTNQLHPFRRSCSGQGVLHYNAKYLEEGSN